jgi:predicted 3-demethylubiquinone-9 3-methyltransferase (glyoxalase superfamily)
MSATTVANGTEILMFNGGPHFTCSPGISLFVKCKDQAEVDLYWNKFIDGGGREDNCGWLQDKWGVSWQIIPDALGRHLGDPRKSSSPISIALRPPSSH